MAKKRKNLNYDNGIKWLENLKQDLQQKQVNYKTPEAAKVIGCNYLTIENMVNIGLLPKKIINFRGDLEIPHFALIHFFKNRANQSLSRSEIEEIVFFEGLTKPRDLAEYLEGTTDDVLYLIKKYQIPNFNVSASLDPSKPYYALPRLRTKFALEEIRERILVIS